MSRLQRFRWGIVLIMTALLLAVLPPPGEAANELGRIVVVAFDEFNGRKIRPICFTLTEPGTSIVVEEVVEQDGSRGYPLGFYDVLVEDCTNHIYAPVSFTNVEIVSWESNSFYPYQATWLNAFMTMTHRATITGRVVDSYAGYPIEHATIMLRTLDGAPFDSTCTNEDGIYQIYAEPDVPVLVTFYRKGGHCSGHDPEYKQQWYPFADTINDATPVTPRLGIHTVAHGALDLNGGFVGRLADPDDPTLPSHPYSVLAWDGGSRSYNQVRLDGTFATGKVGQDIVFEVRGHDGGFLMDPANPSVPMEWDVSWGETVDLGWIGVKRTPAVSGRVTDQYGHPVEDATIYFFEEGDAKAEPLVRGATDAMGYYVTPEPLTGRFTAIAWFQEYNDLTRLDHVNSRWLGDTANRSEAIYIDFDGTNAGNVDFIVNRGEVASATAGDIGGDGPFWLSTDRERDGATALEPVEVSANVTVDVHTSLGTFPAPVSPYLGFDSAGFAATIIYSPPAGSPTLEVEFAYEPDRLTQPFDAMKIVWNGRILRSCAQIAPPCEQGRGSLENGDHTISVTIAEGGEASFVWGPSFLDTGVSIFRNDIEWLVEEGVTKGCSPPINDLYCPTDQVTRGQMAAFLVRFLGLSDRGDVDFTDDDGSVFEADIEKLAAAGITRGCNPPANDEFCPHDPVTREQMAAFLNRALELPGATLVEFTDDDGSIFEDAIARLATAGITRGCNPPVNDRFCPSATVTREQMAAFLHRAYALRP